MSDYKKIITSAEVFAVIHARHKDLKVFSSYSAPDGDYLRGNTTGGVMFTSYGFDNADFPIMEAETKWDIERETPFKRVNEQHTYWLCVPVKESSD